MVRLTATLITLNEQRNLPRALASLREVADEILVVDCGSADQTCEIARHAGARTLHHSWTDYSQQKNYAATQAGNDWILSIDADEALSAELRDELRHWKQQSPEAVAYSMPRKAWYLGGWIHHSGWYPDRKLRLYHRDRAHFVGALHESLQADGPVRHLTGDLHHYTFDSLSQHVARANHYTTLAARQSFAAGRRRWLSPLLVAPPWTFLRTFILQQGFRDGYRGWLIAQTAAYYVFLKHLKLGLLLHGASLDREAGSKNA